MIPKLDSRWKACDGRLLRVEHVEVPDDPAKEPIVTLEVVRGGTRKWTKMGSSNFNPGAFLEPAIVITSNDLK